MDGRGRWMDNVFIGCGGHSNMNAFLTAFETGSEARTGIGRHSTFNGRTPDEVYARQESEEKLAA